MAVLGLERTKACYATRPLDHLVGNIVAIPLAAVAYLLWAVGPTVGYLAIAERLVGRGDDRLKPLLAAVKNGALALTAVGATVSLCIGAAGFGVVLRRALE